VHVVGTVVFTVSAQFGVPALKIWALRSDITSVAREAVVSLAGVELMTDRGCKGIGAGHNRQRHQGGSRLRRVQGFGAAKCF
jgi:hypothetical protein